MYSNDPANDINDLLLTLTEQQPVRDTHGYSRAYQMALTKLEEAKLWMEEAQRKRDEKHWTATGS